jgi:hypothetical protein
VSALWTTIDSICIIVDLSRRRAQSSIREERERGWRFRPTSLVVTDLLLFLLVIVGSVVWVLQTVNHGDCLEPENSEKRCNAVRKGSAAYGVAGLGFVLA